MDQYHEGLASVKLKSTVRFLELDRGVINGYDNITDAQKLRLTNGYIYNSDAQLRSMLNSSANIALDAASGSIGVSVGRGSIGTRITSNTQQAIVTRSFINQVTDIANIGQQGNIF